MYPFNGQHYFWKPSDYQIFSLKWLWIYLKAGLPDGVINMILVTQKWLQIRFYLQMNLLVSILLDLLRFKNIWRKIGNNIDRYKNYPRIVGETGGKDFIMVHPTANIEEVSIAVIRGAFEFQGQKCSAASRVYLQNQLEKGFGYDWK